MRDIYFNEFEFNQVLKMLNICPDLSKDMFEQYLKKYPKDYSAYPYYCSNLIILNRLEEAENFLNYFEKIYYNDKKNIDPEKNKKIMENIFFSKIKLLSYQKKYEELYQFCSKNIEYIISREMNSVLFYAKKLTGRLNLNRRDENSYLFSQLVKYEEKDFFEHIKKHLVDSNECKKEKNACVFCENFPIKNVVEEIKKYIPSDKKLLWGFYDDIYYFKYDNCGRSNDKIVNYFKVVCIHDTKEFITMCPVQINENLPYIDLNYMVNEELPKIKKISQIDKFNQRFNRK